MTSLQTEEPHFVSTKILFLFYISLFFILHYRIMLTFLQNYILWKVHTVCNYFQILVIPDDQALFTLFFKWVWFKILFINEYIIKIIGIRSWNNYYWFAGENSYYYYAQLLIISQSEKIKIYSSKAFWMLWKIWRLQYHLCVSLTKKIYRENIPKFETIFGYKTLQETSACTRISCTVFLIVIVTS